MELRKSNGNGPVAQVDLEKFTIFSLKCLTVVVFENKGLFNLHRNTMKLYS